MDLKKIIDQFLAQYCDPNRILLLALSGGPDSLTLFDLLKDYPIAVAHVDHSWRPESCEEALILKKLVEDRGIPFHLKTLSPGGSQANLEALCRLERLNYFKELCLMHNYQAVVVGHHQDDQAETVLKRVLEGHPLVSLQGMQEVVDIEGINYWRPLLNVPKKGILQWIKQQQLKPFHDKTNEDPRFLRAKMRTQIIPNLSEQFGKEVQEPLCRLARESYNLNEYLNQQIKDYPVIEEGLGFYLLVPKELHFIEKRHLIHSALKKTQIFPNFNQLEHLCKLVSSADCSVEIDGRTVYLDRHNVFIPKVEMKPVLDQTDLSLGTHQLGPWQVTVKEVDNQKQTTNWQHVWRGKAVVTLPKKMYQIGPAKNISFRGSIMLSKWWTNHKVPAFLRSLVPIVWESGKIEHEFLTGKNKYLENKPLKFLEVELQWNP